MYNLRSSLLLFAKNLAHHKKPFSCPTQMLAIYNRFLPVMMMCLCRIIIAMASKNPGKYFLLFLFSEEDMDLNSDVVIPNTSGFRVK